MLIILCVLLFVASFIFMSRNVIEFLPEAYKLVSWSGLVTFLTLIGSPFGAFCFTNGWVQAICALVASCLWGLVASVVTFLIWRGLHAKLTDKRRSGYASNAFETPGLHRARMSQEAWLKATQGHKPAFNLRQRQS